MIYFPLVHLWKCLNVRSLKTSLACSTIQRNSIDLKKKTISVRVALNRFQHHNNWHSTCLFTQMSESILVTSVKRLLNNSHTFNNTNEYIQVTSWFTFSSSQRNLILRIFYVEMLTKCSKYQVFGRMLQYLALFRVTKQLN